MVKLRVIFNNYRNLIENTGYLSIIEVVKLILPFIALPYLIRTIGADNYGMVVFVQTIISYFSILINFGLDISAIRDVSINRNNPRKLAHIVSSVLLIKVIILIFSFLLLCVGNYLFPHVRMNFILYLFSFLTCFSEVLFPIWFFLGIEKMKYLTLIRLSSVLFYTLSIFMFIHEKNDYRLVALLYSLGNIFAGLISMMMLLRIEKIRLLWPSYEEVKICFLESVPFFISRLSLVFNGAIAKTICGVFFSMNTVAAFDLAQKLSAGAIVPAMTLNQAVYPHIARTQDKQFAQKFFYANAFLAFMIALIGFIASPWLIRIFAGDVLPEAVMILRILCLYILCGNITVYLGTPLLVAFGYSKFFNKSVVLQTFFLWFVMGVFYICGMFSVNVLALILGISELFLLLYRLYYCCYYKILFL